MNRKELQELSALVDRRLALKAMLDQPTSGDNGPMTPRQRQAVRQLLEEKSDEYLRLEEAVRRLGDQLDRIEMRLGAGQGERVRRIQGELDEVGEKVRGLRRRIHPLTLGEARAGAILDPYVDDTAPMAERVGVPDGDL